MRKAILLCVFAISGLFVSAQETAEDPNIEKAYGLVSYYRFMLNTVGKANTPPQEKEVIIRSSYEKAFRDPEVQIEDDLLLDRQVIINKNVQAYLRDVDFFFIDVSFDFSELEIKPDTTETGEVYYLASFISTIEGTSLEGNPIKNSKERYIEINNDPNGDGLKIVSVYSTKLSRDQQLREWWDPLSDKWKEQLMWRIGYVGDSISNRGLELITQIDSLDLSSAKWVDDLSALSMIRGLRYLNIRNTAITDLSPIRYATQLEKLNVSNTPLTSLDFLEYFTELVTLDISRTGVSDLTPLSYLSRLRELYASNLEVFDYSPISKLKSLIRLDISFSTFANEEILSGLYQLVFLNLENSYLVKLEGLTNLKQLQELNISNTYVASLQPLSQLPDLRVLYLNHTDIGDLGPLRGSTNLTKIYADYTKISDVQATSFMRSNPSILVVTNTDKVIKWWDNLSDSWKNALEQSTGIQIGDNKEQLIKLLLVDSLNISGKRFVEGEALKNFEELRYLNIDGNLFIELGFLEDIPNLKTLSAKNVPVDDITPIGSLSDIENIDISGTLAGDITPLFTLRALDYLNIENTKVDEQQVRRLLTYNEACLVIFRTEALSNWWASLNGSWKKSLKKYISDASTENLHRLVTLDTLVLSGSEISILDPITEFFRLKKITLSDTRVTDLTPLRELEALVDISYTNGPLSSLESVYSLFQIQSLTVSNTPIEDLGPISSLRNLKKLDCSGTQIKNIRDLRELMSLRYLDISNTRVWQLHWLFDIPEFEVLICYNSRVRDNKLEEFRARFPDCDITYY